MQLRIVHIHVADQTQRVTLATPRCDMDGHGCPRESTVNTIHFGIGEVGLAGVVSLERSTHALEHIDTLSDKSIAQVVKRIEADPSAKFNIAELAAEAGYSYSHFLHLFRSHTGRSPYQYILVVRLKHAQKLLTDHSLPLLEIALASGFDSHPHFSFAFRNHFGLSPTEYRRNLMRSRR